jgi:hypothetical protein
MTQRTRRTYAPAFRESTAQDEDLKNIHSRVHPMVACCRESLNIPSHLQNSKSFRKDALCSAI